MTQANAKQTAKTIQPPKDWGKFIGGLKLLDLRIREGSYRFSNKLYSAKPPFSIHMDIEASFAPQGRDLFEVEQVFTLKVRAKGKKQILGSVKCVVVVLYSSKSVQMDDALFEIFKQGTLLLNTWPFIREFTHSCTQRAGLPPLVLPLTKFVP